MTDNPWSTAPVPRPEEEQLLRSLKGKLPELEKLLEHASSHWGYEDPVYRYYHQSFKVHYLQDTTMKITEALKSLAPHLPLNTWFQRILAEGTGKTFKIEDNQNWEAVTRPILEAFFHARYFLEMGVRYGKEDPRTLRRLREIAKRQHFSAGAGKRRMSDYAQFDPPLAPGKYRMWLEGTFSGTGPPQVLKSTPMEVDLQP